MQFVLYDWLTVRKAPTTVSWRHAHTQACKKLAPAVFLSPPLTSLRDGGSSQGVKRKMDDPAVVVVEEGRGTVSKFSLFGLYCKSVEFPSYIGPAEGGWGVGRPVVPVQGL